MPNKSKTIKPFGNRPPKLKQEGRYFRDARYDTRRWRSIRRQGLEQEPWCADCLKLSPPIFTQATVRDHITPVSMGGDFWNMSNHQSQCDKHHNSKSGKERHTKHANR